VELAFEIGHLCTFQTSVSLTLDQVICPTIMYHLYLETKFRSNQKKFLRMAGQRGTDTGIIRSTQRSKPKNVNNHASKLLTGAQTKQYITEAWFIPCGQEMNEA